MPSGYLLADSQLVRSYFSGRSLLSCPLVTECTSLPLVGGGRVALLVSRTAGEKPKVQ